MTSVEDQVTKETRSTNDQRIRASVFVLPSSFDLRHSSFLSSLLSVFASWRAAVLLAAILLPVAGCWKGSTLPETFPVRGKVVFQGGEPVRFRGSIDLRPQEDPTVSTVGEIRENGTFTLHSFKAGGRAPGALAGPHRVTVTLVLSEGTGSPHKAPSPDNVPSAPIAPPQLYSVTLPDLHTIRPGDNDLTLTIPPPGR